MVLAKDSISGEHYWTSIQDKDVVWFNCFDEAKNYITDNLVGQDIYEFYSSDVGIGTVSIEFTNI
jgi:hypothetical protein